jgi:Rrf2 family transcriptional regulator, iron-sulfur cluster assembly transcription factor
MKLSTKGRYALRAVVDLAEEGQGGYLSLKAIARRQRLPIKYLEALFAVLVKKNILTSRRGIDGGYALAAPPARISAYDVLSAIEGELQLVECDPAGVRCLRSGKCRTRSLWQEVTAVIRRKFKYTSIADLAKVAK